MIEANCAIQLSQVANRQKWLKHASEHVSQLIQEKAKTGERSINIPLNIFVVGAENLTECAEMLVLLGRELDRCGYTQHVDLEGQLHISW